MIKKYLEEIWSNKEIELYTHYYIIRNGIKDIYICNDDSYNHLYEKFYLSYINKENGKNYYRFFLRKNCLIRKKSKIILIIREEHILSIIRQRKLNKILNSNYE